MVPLLAALASRQFDVFTAAQAQQAGYSDDEIRARVRAGEWTSLRRGIYAETAVATAARSDPDAFHRVRAAAGVLALSKGALASHQSAAALHGLPLVGPIGSAAHTTRPEGPPRSYKGLVVHELPVSPENRSRLGDIPVTDVSRTALDCCQTLEFRSAVVVMEAALFRELTSEPTLAVALQTLPRRYRRSAQRVLDFASSASESPGESLSRVLFASHGLPMPQQQEEFDDESGFIGRVDFFWPEHGVIAEFDGQVKYNDRSSIVSEKLREDRLRELGYEVVRITWSEVLNEPAKVAQRIRAAMGRAAARRRRVAR